MLSWAHMWTQHDDHINELNHLHDVLLPHRDATCARNHPVLCYKPKVHRENEGTNTGTNKSFHGRQPRVRG